MLYIYQRITKARKEKSIFFFLYSSLEPETVWDTTTPELIDTAWITICVFNKVIKQIYQCSVLFFGSLWCCLTTVVACQYRFNLYNDVAQCVHSRKPIYRHFCLSWFTLLHPILGLGDASNVKQVTCWESFNLHPWSWKLCRYLGELFSKQTSSS